jgi:hypothetical protein
MSGFPWGAKMGHRRMLPVDNNMTATGVKFHEPSWDEQRASLGQTIDIANGKRHDGIR